MARTKRNNLRRKKRKTRRNMKGGFVKQDIVNFGRQLGFGAQSAYRGLMGVNAPTNPSPLIQNIIKR